jgi:hypothetical protein
MRDGAIYQHQLKRSIPVIPLESGDPGDNRMQVLVEAAKYNSTLSITILTISIMFSFRTCRVHPRKAEG